MPDKVEQNKAQQIAAGGPDPDTTRGDTGPGSWPRAGGEGGTPGASGKAKGTGRTFVVLHSLVGAHEQGCVVAESDFPEGTDFGRLERLGAIRPTEGDESDRERVTILGTSPHLDATAEAQVAEKDKEIRRLQAEKAELETKVAARVAASATDEANRQSAAVTNLLQAKDARIAELERENRELKAHATDKAAKGK